MITANSRLIQVAIRWILVAIGALILTAALRAQPVVTGPIYDSKRPMPLGDYSTRPWLNSPNVSPYLLLEERHPFDTEDNDESIRYYLQVRPMLDYNESLRREQLHSFRPHSVGTPYRPQPSYNPGSAQGEAPSGSRFMNYGRYYQYPSRSNNHLYYSPAPPTNQSYLYRSY